MLVSLSGILVPKLEEIILRISRVDIVIGSIIVPGDNQVEAFLSTVIEHGFIRDFFALGEDLGIKSIDQSNIEFS